MNSQAIIRRAAANWFYVVMPIWLLAAWNLHRTFDWSSDPRMGEAIAIGDWCVFIPLLHVVCYRRLPYRALAIRTLALTCGGLWMAGIVVPDGAEHILLSLRPLRGVGLAILLVVEAVASIAIIRCACSAQPDVSELAKHGIPPVVIRLMIAEARFWRRLYDALLRR